MLINSSLWMVTGDEAGAGVGVEVVGVGEDFEAGAEEVEVMEEVLDFRKVSRTLRGSAVKFRYSFLDCQLEPRSRSSSSISPLWGRSRWTGSAGSPGFTFTRTNSLAR